MSVILLFDSLILIYLFNNDRKFCHAIPFPHFKMSSPRMENKNNHFEAKILIEKASNLLFLIDNNSFIEKKHNEFTIVNSLH